ncbi:hypothetical protein JYT36_00535 [Bacteroidales bacterium AH-315-N07]|nr:hypothetical protein [Bacteroidales bacterium AH-315-N07]
MKETEFTIVLSDGVRKRHQHKLEKGKVVNFVVQLEVQFKNKWKPVIRYDCAHGFSHIDKYDKKGNQKKEKLNLDFQNALTLADHDINENWKKYIKTFLKK